MLRRPKQPTIEDVAPKEDEEVYIKWHMTLNNLPHPLYNTFILTRTA